MVEKKKNAIVCLDEFLKDIPNDIKNAPRRTIAYNKLITEYPKARLFTEHKGIEYFRVD